jgi:hypothetical protein
MENEAILLSATWDDRNLHLRIDRNGLAVPGFDPLPVEVIELESCEVDDRFQDALADSLYRAIEYQVFRSEEQVQIIFWFGYVYDDFELHCKKFAVTYDENTSEEWRRKCERLGAAYRNERRLADVNSFLYQTLLDKVQKENNHDQDICQRKIEFFTGKEPEKAEKYQQNLKIFQKQLSFTGVVDRQDLRNRIRFLFMNMYDEDGFELHMQRNEESREEIVKMGEAAIFPLLEDLRSIEPSWRPEILNLLEKISPHLFSVLQQRPELFENPASD